MWLALIHIAQNVDRKKAKDQKIPSYVFSSILSLFVSLIYACLSTILCLHALHPLLSSVQPLDYKGYRQCPNFLLFFFYSKHKTSTKRQQQKKEIQKPHLLHKALQMQCLLAMLQLFCATAHASLELTCFRAVITLSGTFTFCESQCAPGGEHRALGLMQVQKTPKIHTNQVIKTDVN